MLVTRWTCELLIDDFMSFSDGAGGVSCLSKEHSGSRHGIDANSERRLKA